MNNLGFNKTAFVKNEPARIAGKVLPNNQGAVSVNQIMSNMQALRRGGSVVNSSFEDGAPIVEKPQIKAHQGQSANRSEVERMRMQALKNVGKKW